MRFKALLLDLDGTLLDTAPDMVSALNRLLISEGKSEIDYITASKFVSKGAAALVKLGFGLELKEVDFERLRQAFLKEYEQHICVDTKPFDGMLEILDWCEKKDIYWGIVTNKPDYLAKPILDQLQLTERSAVNVGGTTLSVTKPHPAPLLHCTTLLHIAPSDCLYVGDDERDIQAGRAAGMDTAVANWGYIDDDINPEDWKPNFICNRPEGLFRLIKDLDETRNMNAQAS